MMNPAELLDELLCQEYPDARCELNYSSPFELLVATVLSAQTTDIRVNQVTSELFARYPDPTELVAANNADLTSLLRPLGFHRAKAKSLLGLSQRLLSDFAGEVPGELAALLRLPGVGRKTANVVLGNAFGIPGITVDTHVGRLSRRLALTTQQNPVKVEADLMAQLPRERWTDACHRLIFHGRRCCLARSPRCGQCILLPHCPQVGVAR